jgi:hypothetical protein
MIHLILKQGKKRNPAGWFMSASLLTIPNMTIERSVENKNIDKDIVFIQPDFKERDFLLYKY